MRRWFLPAVTVAVFVLLNTGSGADGFAPLPPIPSHGTTSSLKRDTHQPIDRHATMMELMVVDVVPVSATMTASSMEVADTATAAALAWDNNQIFSTVSYLAQTGGIPAVTVSVALTDSIPFVFTQPISIAIGALFGFQLGLPMVVVGQAMAAAFAIIVGRALQSTPQVQRYLDNMDPKPQKVLKSLTRGLNAQGDWKQVFNTIVLVRQSPVIPFSIGNYFVGAATEAPIVPALAGTVVGCLPLNAVWVAAGAGGKAALEAAASGEGLAGPLEVVGVVATMLLSLVIATKVAGALKDVDSEQDVV